MLLQYLISLTDDTTVIDLSILSGAGATEIVSLWCQIENISTHWIRQFKTVRMLFSLSFLFLLSSESDMLNTDDDGWNGWVNDKVVDCWGKEMLSLSEGMLVWNRWADWDDREKKIIVRRDENLNMNLYLTRAE